MFDDERRDMAQTVRSMVAAQAMLDSKMREHEAACIMVDQVRMAEARQTVMKAMEDVLAAREKVAMMQDSLSSFGGNPFQTKN